MENLAQLVDDIKERLSRVPTRGAMPRTLGELLANEAELRRAMMTAQDHLLEALETSPPKELSEEERNRIEALFGDEQPTIPEALSELVGVEVVIAQLLRYLRAARESDEQQRCMLYVVGPTGSGKTTLLEKLCAMVTGHTWALKECPIGESPIHALPADDQLALARMLGLTIIPGRLCGSCRSSALSRDGGSILELPVQRLSLQHIIMGGRVVLTGNQESDHMLLAGMSHTGATRKSNGALVCGHAGIAVISGLDKHEGGVRQVLHDAISDRHVACPTGGDAARISTLIIGMGNEVPFQGDSAMRDRIHLIRMPHNVSSRLEAGSLCRRLKTSSASVTFLPHAIHVAATFAGLTRIFKDTMKNGNDLRLSKLDRLALYNGDILVRRGARVMPTWEELSKAYPEDGQKHGISHRFLLRVMSDIAADARAAGKRFLCGHEVLDELVLALTREGFDNFAKEDVELARQCYHEWLIEDLSRALQPELFAQVDTLAQTYLAHIDALRTNNTVKEANQRVSPDQDLIDRVESAVEVSTDEERERFRSAFGRKRLSQIARGQGGRADERSYPLIRYAVERSFYEQCRSVVQSFTSADIVRDDEFWERRRGMGEILVKSGYHPDSIDTILKYAANHLWRD